MPGPWDHSNRLFIDHRPIYFARCIYCSFEGPERRSKTDAERDMDSHVGTASHQKAVRA